MDSRPMAGLCTVKLTVDGLRHSILQVLPKHAETIRTTIEHEVDNAVRAFDFPAEVRRAAEFVIQEQVKYAVSAAIDSIMSDPEVRCRIREMVLKSLREEV